MMADNQNGTGNIPDQEAPNNKNTLEESPSHDSSSICSPDRTSDNELEHDADSDSSCSGGGPDYQTKQRTKENRRKSRRTSSNVFIARKFDSTTNEFFERAGRKLNEFEDLNEMERKGTKQVLCESYSSSTDENELTDSASTTSTLQYELPSHLDLTESVSSSGVEDSEEARKTRKMTAVDGLLFEIYDRFHSRGSSIVESDITECSTTSMNSVYITSSFENDERPMMDQGFLETKSMSKICLLFKGLIFRGFCAKNCGKIREIMSEKILNIKSSKNQEMHPK